MPNWQQQGFDPLESVPSAGVRWSGWANRWALLLMTACLSCSSHSPPTGVNDETHRWQQAVVARVASDVAAQGQVAETLPKGFDYPADLMPQLVPILAPDTPALSPLPRWSVAARPWPVSGTFTGLFSPPALAIKLPPAPSPLRSHKSNPLYPRDAVSPHGLWAVVAPSPPVWPPGQGLTLRAPDPSVPPPLPRLGQPISERVSLEDPTTESHHALLKGQHPPVPFPPLAFQKVEIPDPYQLGEQIRPQHPDPLEPGRLPVFVPAPHIPPPQ